MASVLEFWRANKNFLQEKAIQQIIPLLGDGKLRDNSVASAEYRELLENIPSHLLSRYAEECLNSAFENSGYALQDIVNQIGARMGFQVEPGLYKGVSNKVGFDGIWSTQDNYQMVVEVKTTDTYRINLDTLAAYRTKLIEQSKIDKRNSSILIIVGRDDTGDLEAQIRGSRQAWDIRLISVLALIKLMTLKESLSDSKTVHQIHQILRPLEYTRIDRIIDIMFLASEDLQTEVVVSEELETEDAYAQTMEAPSKPSNILSATPASFHDECIERTQQFLGISLIKERRNQYTSPDKRYRIVCAVSKEYPKAHEVGYWYAFHLGQRDYLTEGEFSYVAYGCGSSDKVILIPYLDFEPMTRSMSTTINGQRYYWHVKIFERNNQFHMGALTTGERILLSKYLLP